jgi:predicted nucleic acid-binding protein
LLSHAELVAAPDLFVAEIANVYWKYTRFSSLPVELARASIHAGIAMIHQWESLENLYAEAFEKAVKLNHSAYDCFYLVLAQRLGASLMTSDRKLTALAAELGIAPA